MEARGEVKRTDLEFVRVAPAGLVEVAEAKSADRAGSLGVVVVVEVAEKPWNWEVKASYCFWRMGRWSARETALLEGCQWLFWL